MPEKKPKATAESEAAPVPFGAEAGTKIPVVELEEFPEFDPPPPNPRVKFRCLKHIPGHHRKGDEFRAYPGNPNLAKLLEAKAIERVDG